MYISEETKSYKEYCFPHFTVDNVAVIKFLLGKIVAFSL